MSDDDHEDCPLFVTVRVPDSSVIEHVVGLHAGADAEIETISICNPCQTGTSPVIIDLGNLTQKQWEVIEMAHELGHYSGDRGGNLDEISEQFDISKSAASQRLRAAESRIINAVVGTGQLQCDTVTDAMEDLAEGD